MFQFTTTNVINSLKDLSTGKDLLVKGKDALTVKRVNTFKKEFVTNIYKAKPVEAVNAKVNIDLSTLTDVSEGDQLRLAVYVRLTEGSNSSLYANDGYYKGKPFGIDFVWKKDAATTAEKLAKNVKKYLVAVHDEKIVDVTASGNSIVIEAVTEYQRFAKVSIDKLDPEAHLGMGEYKELISLEDGIEAVDTVAEVAANKIFKGQEGFGTYSWILHNLRIPTSTRSEFMAINQEEAPIPGALYTQFTIHYCVNRGTLGSNAVGDQVTSHTTHVFYIKDDLVSDFESALAVITPADGEHVNAIKSEASIEEVPATED